MPALDGKRIPVSTGLIHRPNLSWSRCSSCGTRLHVLLASRGITEHVICSALPDPAYDALLSQEARVAT